MSLEIKKYRASDVEAVQITEENFRDVAEWVGASVGEDFDPSKKLGIAVGSGWNTRMALVRVGYWVIREGTGTFRVFKPRSFEKVFTEVKDDVVPADA